ELEDFHSLAGGGSDLFELLVFDQDVAVLGVLVALDQLRALHRAVAGGAVNVLFDPGVALLVDLVEADPFVPRCYVQAHRHRDHAKTKIALPNRAGHAIILSQEERDTQHALTAVAGRTASRDLGSRCPGPPQPPDPTRDRPGLGPA